MLLTAGAQTQQADYLGLLPISYACLFNHSSTIQILLSHNCALSAKVPRSDPNIIQVCVECEDLEVLQLVSSNLYRRRVELLHVAQTYLSPDKLRTILPPGEYVPDASTDILVTELQDTGYVTDPHYWGCSDQGVFHTRYLSVAQADILYDTGFHDVNSHNLLGETPLMSQPWWSLDCDLDLVEWFCRKKASFTDIEELFSHLMEHPSMHWSVMGIAFRVYDYYTSIHAGVLQPSLKFCPDIQQALQLILGEQFHHCTDQCKCQCSTEGCNPIVILLKTLVLMFDERFSERLSLILRYAELVLSNQQTRLSCGEVASISLAANRLILFEMLDIKHCCCRPTQHCSYFKERFDDNEVLEIEDEYGAQIDTFNTLLPLAQFQWEHSPKTFSWFWRDFYRDQILPLAMTLDDNDQRELAAIGVKMKEQQDARDDERSLDDYFVEWDKADVEE